MSHPPTVSFVIPCFNHGHYLLEAITSVELCGPGLCELIIVDDGSTDADTRTVLSDLEFKGYKVIRQANAGVGAARNAGIRASRGKYILPLDSDNKIRPLFVERAAEILTRNESIGVVYGDMQYFGNVEFRANVPDFDVCEMLQLNYIDACAMYRRNLWEHVGGYDESMPGQGLEDWDFWVNAYNKGWKFKHVDEVAQDYRALSGSMLARLKEGDNYLRCEEYIFLKYPRLVRTNYVDLASWDYHGRQLRRRPLHTTFRLLLSAVFPKLHKRRYKRQ